MTVDPARTAVDEGAVAEPAWKGIARQLEAEHAARAGGPIETVDPADFDLDDDCCLGGCCDQGTAYLEALAAAEERAAARRRG